MKKRSERGERSEERRSLFRIDRYHLDDEFESHPGLYWENAEKLVAAREQLDYAESDLELVSADLELQIRKDPTGTGLEKVTEKVVESLVVADDLYQNAKERVIKCKREVAELQAVVNGMEHRKRSLEKLADLMLGGYYSTPRPGTQQSREDREEFNKRAARGGFKKR